MNGILDPYEKNFGKRKERNLSFWAKATILHIFRSKCPKRVTKAETWWTGPVVVQKRTWDASYKIELHLGELQAVHRLTLDKLKPCVQGEPVDLFHFEAG